MISKEEEDSIIFDIRFGNLSLNDVVKEQFTQRICNEIFTKVVGSNRLIGSDTRKLASVLGSVFVILPKEFITQEMCKIAFSEDNYLIMEFPKKYITKEMCEISFEKDTYLITEFPKKYMTKEMCEIAFKKNIDLIAEFPKKYITKEMKEKTK